MMEYKGITEEDTLLTQPLKSLSIRTHTMHRHMHIDFENFNVSINVCTRVACPLLHSFLQIESVWPCEMSVSNE